MMLLGLAILAGEGTLCWIGLHVVRNFGAYTNEQRASREEARQFRLLLNDSMLLLHQYHMAMMKELRAQRKDAA